MSNLEVYGWNDFFKAVFDPFEKRGLEPARVVLQHNHIYRLYSDRGELDATTTGKMRHEAIYPQLSQIAPTVFTERTGVTWKENLKVHADALNKAFRKFTQAFEERADAIYGWALASTSPRLRGGADSPKASG